MKGALIILAIIVILAGLVFIFSGGLSGGESVKNNESVPAPFDTVPPFSLPDFDGKIVSLSDSVGKIRVINSWAVWCPFCVEELDDLAQLQEEFGDDIVVIAIDRAESLAKAKGFTDELGITNSMTFLLDSDDSFYQSIGGFSMPETLFVDGDGNIRIHKRGPMKFNEMKEKVELIVNN